MKFYGSPSFHVAFERHTPGVNFSVVVKGWPKNPDETGCFLSIPDAEEMAEDLLAAIRKERGE